MNVRIYQINMKRDTNNVAFMNYESLPKFQGSSEIDSIGVMIMCLMQINRISRTPNIRKEDEEL